MPGRTRDISPGFFLNENWPCPLAQLLFAGLLCYADREGRLEDRPKRLKPLILPHWDCDVDDLLSALCPEFISRYRVGESRFIQIKKFRTHQKHIHQREAQSEIPPEVAECTALNEPRLDLGSSKASLRHTYTSSSSSSSKKGVQGETNGKPIDLFEEFWGAFPPGRKTKKGDAKKAWRSAVKKENAEAIISAAREYAASKKGRGKFVQMPSSWLNGECWNDDRSAWSRGDDTEAPEEVKARPMTDEEIDLFNKTGTL